MAASNTPNAFGDLPTATSERSHAHDYITSDGKEAAEEQPIERHGSNSDDNDAFTPRERDVLTKLASRSRSFHSNRRSSLASTHTDGNTLERNNTLDRLDLNDDILNPEHPKFDLKTWIRMTLKLLDEEGVKQKSSGFVFRDVNVSGSGSALNIQGTVGGLLTAPTRINELFSFGKKPAKQILRNFDGVVKSGELLIVLGRPGSGCSTLLKSLTGQMHGLKLDEKSHIHYNGVPQEQMLKEFKGDVIYNQVSLGAGRGRD